VFVPLVDVVAGWVRQASAKLQVDLSLQVAPPLVSNEHGELQLLQFLEWLCARPEFPCAWDRRCLLLGDVGQRQFD